MGAPHSLPPCVVFGPAHLSVLVLTGLIGWAMVRRARRRPDQTRHQDRALAVVLLLIYPATVLVGWRLGLLNKDNILPCHLCDMAAICGAGALWFRHQRLGELVWFWGLAGTLNGLITPALSETFPSPRFLSFFALHSGVVIAAVYVVAGLGLRPRPGAVWRAFGWIQVYLVMAAVVNYLTGSNYGFLRSKPDQPSLLDLMGPWPYYIIGLEALALGLFALLYLPFRPSKSGPETAREFD